MGLMTSCARKEVEFPQESSNHHMDLHTVHYKDDLSDKVGHKAERKIRPRGSDRQDGTTTFNELGMPA